MLKEKLKKWWQGIWTSWAFNLCVGYGWRWTILASYPSQNSSHSVVRTYKWYAHCSWRIYHLSHKSLVLWLYSLCPSGWCFPGILPQASALTLQSSLRIKPRLGNFLGSPVVKTPCFQCRGHGFDPWVGNWNPLAGVQTPARPLLQLRIPPARDLTSQSIMLDPYCCERQPLQCSQKEEKSEMGSSPSAPLRPFSQQPASPHSLLAVLTFHLFFRCIKSFPIRGSKGLQFLLLPRGFIQFHSAVSLWLSFAFNTVSSQRTICELSASGRWCGKS